MALPRGKASDFLKIGVAAAGRGDLETVRAVLADRPRWLHRVGSHGRTLLWEAAYRGRFRMVEYLLDGGADIDACGCHFTPLLVDISPYCAAQYRKHVAVADLLLSRGAALDIHTTAYLGDLGAVSDHLDRDPDLAFAEKTQNDPQVRAATLHYAVAPGHAEIVSLLLERGADPRPHGYYLVRFCVWRDRVDILEMLIEAGLDPTTSEPPRSGITNPAMIDLLKDHGVDHGPDHAEGGWPPIVFRSRGDRGGSVARVRELIDASADVNVGNHKARLKEVVRLLVGAGADPGAQDDRAAHHAALPKANETGGIGWRRWACPANGWASCSSIRRSFRESVIPSPWTTIHRVRWARAGSPSRRWDSAVAPSAAPGSATKRAS